MINIPAGVKNIGGGAFYNDAKLEQLELPNGIETIGDYAFVNVKAFKDITFDASLKLIGEEAFRGCSKITSVVFEDSPVEIGQEAFYGCERLTKVDFGRNVKKIGNMAFFGCTDLKNIELSSSVAEIGSGAFSLCYAIESLVIGVRQIEQGDFTGCTGLNTLEFEDTVVCIGENAFTGIGTLEKMILPQSLTTLGDYAFKDTSIKRVEFPDALINIGDDVFNADLVDLIVCSNEIQVEYCKSNGYNYLDATEEANKSSIKNCDISLEYDRAEYDGTSKKPTVTVKHNGNTLTKDTDYTVAYSANKEVGTATVTITGIGSYENTKDVTFTIYEEEEVNKTSIKDCDVTLEYDRIAYDGTAKKPTVTVKYNNKMLTKDTDYTIAYSDNTAVGTATVTIKGINNYSEQKILEFEIFDESDYLKLNTPNSISIPADGEIVTYKIKLEKQGKVEFVFDGYLNMGGVELCEIDADGNETCLASVYQSYSGTGIKQYCLDPIRLTAGIYIIHVKNMYSEQADLTIKYTEEDPSTSETEKNNSFSDANVIDLNKEYNANIQNSTDEDYFKFELAQEGSLYVNLRNTGTIEKRWKVELYNEKNNGNRELINSWYNTTNKNSRFTKYRFPKGVYYIKVSGEGFGYYNEWETGDYSIGTVYVAETKDKSEIEYNDSFETANIINVNNEYAGNIPTDKDIDYYTFTLEEDSDVSVQLKQENDEIKNCLYKVILYRKNDDGVLVVFDSFLSDSKTLSTGSDISIPAGKYYLCVKNNNGTPEDKNDYKIKINQLKAKEAVTLHGSPKDVAGQSGTPMSVNSTVVANDKENRFIFNIAKSGRVSLNAVPHRYEYGVKGYIALYKTDEDENEILIRGKGTWNGVEYERVEEINTATEILSPGTYIVICDLSQAALTINYEELPELSESKIAAVSDQIYTGDGITPKLSITYKGRTLVENRDYTTVYSNNISVGTASVMIKSVEGASVGSNQTSFKILKREISVPVAQQSEFVYDKTEKQLVINGEDLKYLIADNDKATNAGTYRASYDIDTNNCVWKDNHTGPVQIEWTIKKATADINVTQTAYEKEQEDGAFALDGITTSSDGVIAYTVKEGTDVITVNEAGLVTILKPGKAVISVKVNESSNYTESLEKTIDVEVKAHSVGSEIKVGNAYFEVTASSGSAHTVEFIKPDKNSYTSYTIPTTVTSDSGEVFIVTAVSEKAFYNNKKLKQVTIPNTIKSIGNNAFNGCNNLTKAKVGSGVETIGDSAFKNCTKLTSITLPKTVTKIGKNTFNGCKKLKSITIKSNKVIKIGANALKGVSNKCVIKVPRKLVKKYKKVLTKKTGFKKGMKIKKI